MSADITRIAANIPAMKNINILSKVSDNIAKHQLRLATGKRINSPAEDPAGYMLARGLESRKRGLQVALDNVSNAQNILDVAEGAYSNVMDILQTLKEKATQAADGSLNSTQRSAIDGQAEALISEIDDLVDNTKFNGTQLIDGSYSTYFQTGEGGSEQLQVSLGAADSASLGINAIDLSTANGASTAIGTISSAIDTLADHMKDLGEYKIRLQSKESNLSNAITNTESVRSTLEDADFAKEQMEVMKLQILQQTSLSSLTQANAAPQLVLSMFR
ncbi:flagellin [candidate division KSB1 bacterium]|nr:MAG: flagellin [candidate division KSB1 bacterium]